MAAALPVVRSLFAVASRGDTGVFRIERRVHSQTADQVSVSRLELEQGYVHAMANVGESPRGEETLLALLGRLPDEAQPAFAPRAPRGPLSGQPVPAFHPARALRRHVEENVVRGAPAPSDEAWLELQFRPHASCIDGAEAQLLAMLDVPRHFGDLAARAPRLLAERLVGFLEAAGALAVADPATAAAWAALGLPVGAPPEEIKHAWRQLARELHPDLHVGAADAERLAQRFQAASAAYRRLLRNG